MAASKSVSPRHVAEVRSWFEGRARHVPDIIPVDPDDTAVWLIQRRTGLGGSDIAAILGHSPHTGALGVYLDKIGARLDDDEDVDPAQAEWAYWGHKLEQVVAVEFEKRVQLAVEKPGVMFRHPAHRWMLATPDRLVFSTTSGVLDSGLEIKTRSAHVAKQWANGAIPQEVYDQVQQYIEVLGLEYYWLAALIGGQSMLHAKVDRDEELIAAIIQAGETFWHEHVDKRVPPPADATDGTTSAVKGAFQASEAKVQLEGDANVRTYYELGQTIKQLDADRTKVANEIRMALGPAEEGWFNGRPVITWRQAAPRLVFDMATLQRDLPQVYAKYQKTVPGSRTLRLTRVVTGIEEGDE